MDRGGRPGWSTRSGLDAKEWTEQDDRGGVPGRDWTLLILEQTGVDRPGEDPGHDGSDRWEEGTAWRV